MSEQRQTKIPYCKENYTCIERERERERERDKRSAFGKKKIVHRKKHGELTNLTSY